MHHSKLSLLTGALTVVLGSYSTTALSAPQDAPYATQGLPTNNSVNYQIDYATLAPAPAPTPTVTNTAAVPAPAPAPAATSTVTAPTRAAAPAQVYEHPVPAQAYEQVLPHDNGTTNYTVSYGTTNPQPALAPAPAPTPAPAPATYAVPTQSAPAAAYGAPADETAAPYGSAAGTTGYGSAAGTSGYEGAPHGAGAVAASAAAAPSSYGSSATPVMEELGASPTSAAEPSFNFSDEQSGAATGSVLGEQIQEVSVPLISTLDNALLDGFKSLASGLTMGMGVEVDSGSSSSFNYTLDDIAPALRGFNYEPDGSVVMSFSVPMVQNILKKQGDVAWSGLSNPVLVWMVSLDGTTMDLTSGQDLNSFAQALLAAAPDYKYRLMFPILDLQERNSISATTVLDHQAEALALASERYGSDYFILATLSSVPNEPGVTLKWNLYDKEGGEIGSSTLSGIASEVAALSTGDIARTLMGYQATLTEQVTPSRLKGSNVDIDMLGPGEGFVRFKLTNIKSLQDLQAMRNALVRYGFDGSINIIGYNEGNYIIELVTNSNATNLEGTMRRAGDFVYLAPWTFSLSENITYRPPINSPVTPQNPERPNSVLKAPGSTVFSVPSAHNQGRTPRAILARPVTATAAITPAQAQLQSAQPAYQAQTRPAAPGALNQVGPYQTPDAAMPNLPF